MAFAKFNLRWGIAPLAFLSCVSVFPCAVSASVVETTGTVEPAETVEVPATVASTIVRLGVDAKDHSRFIDYNAAVEKGSILAQLDSTSCESACKLAKAELDSATTAVKLDEAKSKLAALHAELVKKRPAENASSPFEAEIADAEVDVASADLNYHKAQVERCKSQMQLADAELARCTIRSPISGVVIDNRCKVGQQVDPKSGTGLFLIATVDKMQISAEVDETQVRRVAKGNVTKITVDAIPDNIWKGRVISVHLNAILRKDKVYYTVVSEVDNANGRLLPYLTAKVSIDVGDR